MGFVHFHFDTEDTLSEEDMTDGIVDKVTNRLTGMDHEAIGELHGFCSGSTKLARDDNLTTLRTRFHNEAEDTVASTVVLRNQESKMKNEAERYLNAPANSKTTKELVAERFALSDSRESTVLDFFSVEFERIFGEFESLLNEGGEFTDTTTLLAKDLLSVGGTDDDLIVIPP